MVCTPRPVYGFLKQSPWIKLNKTSPTMHHSLCYQWNSVEGGDAQKPLSLITGHQ